MKLFVTVLAVLFSAPALACDRAVYANADSSLILIMFNDETEPSLVEIQNSQPRRCVIEWNLGMNAWIGGCTTGDPVAVQFFQGGEYAFYNEAELQRLCF